MPVAICTLFSVFLETTTFYITEEGQNYQNEASKYKKKYHIYDR